MFRQILATVVLVGLTVAPSQARHRHQHHVAHHVKHHVHHRVKVAPAATRLEWNFDPFTPIFKAPAQAITRATEAVREAGAVMLPHPSNCPRTAFCGCGAADEVGRPNDRSLWLAANWFKFPRTEPAPGMAAVKRHHVFVLKKHKDGDKWDKWLVIDHNSGHHQSRIHVRSIRGYVIVNPS